MQLGYVGTIGITWHFTFSQQVSTINKIVAVIMMKCREKAGGRYRGNWVCVDGARGGIFHIIRNRRIRLLICWRALISPHMKYR